MSPFRFEWDPRKATANKKKHGISFHEAQSVFFDEQALLLEDPQPLHEEERLEVKRELDLQWCPQDGAAR